MAKIALGCPVTAFGHAIGNSIVAEIEISKQEKEKQKRENWVQPELPPEFPNINLADANDTNVLGYIAAQKESDADKIAKGLEQHAEHSEDLRYLADALNDQEKRAELSRDLVENGEESVLGMIFGDNFYTEVDRLFNRIFGSPDDYITPEKALGFSQQLERAASYNDEVVTMLGEKNKSGQLTNEHLGGCPRIGFRNFRLPYIVFK